MFRGAFYEDFDRELLPFAEVPKALGVLFVDLVFDVLGQLVEQNDARAVFGFHPFYCAARAQCK